MFSAAGGSPQRRVKLFAAAAKALSVAGVLGRWEKLIGREFNSAEEVAGVLSRVFTLLFGNAKIINGNKHLNISNELNDAEKTKCNKNGGGAALTFGANLTAKALANAGRNAAAALVAVADFADSCRKGNGVNALNNATRCVRGAGQL